MYHRDVSTDHPLSSLRNILHDPHLHPFPPAIRIRHIRDRGETRVQQVFPLPLDHRSAEELCFGSCHWDSLFGGVLEDCGLEWGLVYPRSYGLLVSPPLPFLHFLSTQIKFHLTTQFNLLACQPIIYVHHATGLPDLYPAAVQQVDPPSRRRAPKPDRETGRIPWVPLEAPLCYRWEQEERTF